MKTGRSCARWAVVAAWLFFSFSSVGSASAAPADWIRADQGLTLTSTADSTPVLFSFDRWVYVQSDAGLFVQLYNSPCFGWEQIAVPAGAEFFKPVGNYLYAGGLDVWWAGLGGLSAQPSWNQVSSTGVPSGAIIRPRALFHGQLYADVVTTSGTFDIYRTPDIGKTAMAWSRVVSAGFADPLNHELGCLIEYDGALIAVTSNTRTNPAADFGNQDFYGTGIEVWQSASGDLDSWIQINQDGFNTQVTLEHPAPLTIRTNQDFGSAVVYNGYLYVGTKAHWHAGEVWRYDGGGLDGWTAVTPQGMCFTTFPECGGPSRATDMVVYEGLLYLAEGYPTGNLETFDGTTWTIVVARPPFDPVNDGVDSLAVLPSLPTPSGGSTGEKLFAVTKIPGGAQIWSYPFSMMPPSCADLKQATIEITPKTAESELFPGATHTYTVTVDAGAGFDFGQVWVPFSSCVNQTYYQDGGSVACADGWVYDNGIMTETYKASFLGPIPPLGGPDQIEACFANVEGLFCDLATHSWVDTIAPVIAITTPADGAAYILNQVVAADYFAQDGGGVLSTTAPVPVGAAIPTSHAGGQTFSVVAVDYAGNTASTSVTYQVLTPLQGMRHLSSEVQDSLTKPGIKNGLNAKLAAAIGSLARGNEKAATNTLKAFINMVNAQRGKEITRALASRWMTEAQNIIFGITAG